MFALALAAPGAHQLGDVWFMPREMVAMGSSETPEHPAVVVRVRRTAIGAPAALCFIAGTSRRVGTAHRLQVEAGEAGLSKRTNFHFGMRHCEVSLLKLESVRPGAYRGRLGVEGLRRIEELIAASPRHASLARMTT